MPAKKAASPARKSAKKAVKKVAAKSAAKTATKTAAKTATKSAAKTVAKAPARAVVAEPQLLVADEPTGNLDPNTSIGIMKLLDRINRTGTTVIMATHDQQIVDQMRKRVIELEQGRLVRDQSRGVYGYQH